MKVEVKGLADMTRKLQAKVRRLEQSILRKALQAYAEPIRAATERLARVEISPRMKIVTNIKLRGSSGTVRIGPSTEIFPGGKVSHAKIAYWFEFGYDIRAERKGPSLAHVGSRPSLTPAYQSNKAAAMDAFQTVLRDALEKDIAA